MRLLNVKTRRLESFEENLAPNYAILSHRWQAHEIGYQDVEKSRLCTESHFKIDRCCKQAESERISYVWIDTCNIDKSSSAELSEAINSMYRWYKKAMVCYAYLSDVLIGDGSNFGQSDWFNRGWTLQELLAPQLLVFYDRDWRCLGSRSDLKQEIQDATLIPEQALLRFDPKRYSVAQRMSWAAGRLTTRPEDQAYSLLGIFEVNMPLIYGEGEKAFGRLQEEIIKQLHDYTILAWGGLKHGLSGLLAASPESFRGSGKVCRAIGNQDEQFSISNAGLSISLSLVPWSLNKYVGFLPNCICEPDQPQNGKLKTPRRRYRLGIFLYRSPGRDIYIRSTSAGRNWILENDSEFRNIAVCEVERRITISRSALPHPFRNDIPYGFTILRIDPFLVNLLDSEKAGTIFGQQRRVEISLISRDSEAASHGILSLRAGTTGMAGAVRLASAGFPTIFLHFGCDFDFNPIILIRRSNPEDHGRDLDDVKVDYKLPSVKNSASGAENFRLMDIFEHICENSKAGPQFSWNETGLMAFRGSSQKYMQSFRFNSMMIVLMQDHQTFHVEILHYLEMELEPASPVSDEFVSEKVLSQWQTTSWTDVEEGYR